MSGITTDIVTHLVATGFEADVAALLAQHARRVAVARGDNLFREGDVCESFFLVLSGSFKVRKIAPDGHEMVLYRLDKGDECNLTSACLLGGHRYPAEAVAESDSEVLLVSRGDFSRLVEHQPQFRAMVFKDIDKGMNILLELVQEVAFEQMDRRLAATLLKQSQGSQIIRMTHQELASDLGTAREVVSRLLKEFERHGWVRLRRGLIEVLDRAALARI